MAAPAELESRTAGCVRSGVYIGNPIPLSGLKYPLSQPAGLFRCINGGGKERATTDTYFFLDKKFRFTLRFLANFYENLDIFYFLQTLF
jgi:hypothetical protein